MQPDDFKQLLDDCHLSIPRAVALLDVRSDSVRKWCNGKAEPPQGVIDDLEKLKKAVKGIFK